MSRQQNIDREQCEAAIAAAAGAQETQHRGFANTGATSTGAGSSNDHMNLLGSPFVNPQIPANHWREVNYPTWTLSPDTGPTCALRPQTFGVTLTSKRISAARIATTTRPLVGARCTGLRNQGPDHLKESHVRNICAHKPCSKSLCDRRLCPGGRSNADTRLRFCEDCATERARCTGCGVGGIDMYSHINKEAHGKRPYNHEAISLWPCRPGEGCHNYLCRNAAPPTTDVPHINVSTLAPCGTSTGTQELGRQVRRRSQAHQAHLSAASPHARA